MSLTDTILSHRWEDTTKKASEWVGETLHPQAEDKTRFWQLGRDPDNQKKRQEASETTATWLPLAAAGAVFAAFAAGGNLINNAAKRIGVGIKRLVEHVPIIGGFLAGAVDFVASGASWILGGVAAVITYLGLKSTKNFNPIAQKNRTRRDKYADLISQEIDLNARSVVEPGKTLEERVNDVIREGKNRFDAATQIDRVAAINIVMRQEAEERIKQGEQGIAVPNVIPNNTSEAELRKLTKPR